VRPHVFPFPARRRIAGSLLGEASSARRGESADIAGSRSYVPGDDPRAIDWAGSARLSAARGRDQFLVREFYEEETPVAVILCDRSPSMSAPPAPGTPFLSKPQTLARVAALVADSAFEARSQFAYFEFRGDTPFFSPPGARGARALLEDWTATPGEGGDRSADQLLRALIAERARLPAGTLVFVLSDFAPAPSETVVLDTGWEVVPVVIQDPVWEQSFPLEAAGLVLEQLDGPTRISADDAARLQHEHERRIDEIAAWSARHGFSAVVPRGYQREQLVDTFTVWASRFGRPGRHEQAA
jgi:uncharacterized protein (DUF58 family)